MRRNFWLGSGECIVLFARSTGKLAGSSGDEEEDLISEIETMRSGDRDRWVSHLVLHDLRLQHWGALYYRV